VFGLSKSGATLFSKCHFSGRPLSCGARGFAPFYPACPRTCSRGFRTQRFASLLRKAPKKLSASEAERLETLFQNHPVLRLVHQEMHAFRNLLNIKHQTVARVKRLIPRLLSYIKKYKAENFAPMQTLAKTLHSWRGEIAAMWRFTKNNGITEGFHRKMKLIQRRAYGFRNFQNYRLRVIAACG
jgi:transposase